MRTSALLVQKTFDVSKFMACPHGGGGWLSQCGQEEGVNFSRTSCMDGPIEKTNFLLHKIFNPKAHMVLIRNFEANASPL